MLSPNYSVGMLCVTSQTLKAPNLPSTADQMSNLTQLANFLETLNSSVGPFTILSGFRTPELESVLTANGEPTAPGLSFHEVGRGIDITPTSMNLQDFFGTMLANATIPGDCAEIAYKPSQNSIHLAINVPGDTRDTKVLQLDPSTNTYTAMSPSDIEIFIQPYVPGMAPADSTCDTSTDSSDDGSGDDGSADDSTTDCSVSPDDSQSPAATLADQLASGANPNYMPLLIIGGLVAVYFLMSSSSKKKSVANA